MASVATPQPAGRGARSEGRGRVLAAAFDKVEQHPVLAESRKRLLELAARGAPAHDFTAVIEADAGATIAVVRAAGSESNARVRSVDDAVETLQAAGIKRAIDGVATFDVLDGDPAAGVARSEAFRLHALRVKRAADRIAEIVGIGDRGELALSAIFHDVGRPVLANLHPGYPERYDRRVAPADERLAGERRELGIDHALVGGVLARRWGTHPRVAEAIERHHSKRASGHAAVIRVADMIAARLEDCPVSIPALSAAAASCELGDDGIRQVLYELPQGRSGRPRTSGPCPLSARELDVLRRLAEGKVYKQIAQELDLSASTVRSHLHNVYGKIGALDRAQAVLIATERGWI